MNLSPNLLQEGKSETIASLGKTERSVLLKDLRMREFTDPITSPHLIQQFDPNRSKTEPGG